MSQYDAVSRYHCQEGSSMTVYTMFRAQVPIPDTTGLCYGEYQSQKPIRVIKSKPVVVEFDTSIDLAWLLPAQDSIEVLNLRQADVISLHLLPRFKHLKVLYLWNTDHEEISVPESLEILKTWDIRKVINFISLKNLEILVAYGITSRIADIPGGNPLEVFDVEKYGSEHRSRVESIDWIVAEKYNMPVTMYDGA
ncbi:hypothetical protein SARC_12417 [Sphaeroforma arctica JP610]|uniref:Uncharacterized protein n=1 Tax=Sphaeroforma arctica JP610 TaxID=667725 RepID=A0A0L0FE59_9EUKA|nr:hypothetical protein SARC_12417 [Sphaeroforma arctica JP610]KNC75052.1 hypothetical protein SARC_12417 [Sphaeroforma arctica JP610]|eukprot:XP_014148954.1 hypothetical protein SARC_12417 [Sphaeroforma arctica JP610]